VDERLTDMDNTNEATITSATAWPPIGRSRSLTCRRRSSLSESRDSLEKYRSRSSSFITNDPQPWFNDRGDDDHDDDSEEIRALTSAAASLDDTDDSSEETADVFDDDKQDDRDKVDGGDQSLPTGDYRAPLSSSSASVLGRIAAGFSTAVSGGLHPLKRSTRVAPDLPSPRSPSPKEFFWGPVMPGYPTSPLESDELKGGQSTMVIRQTVQMEQTQISNNNSDGDIGLRQAIPIMPMYLAIVCCLLNILSPGLGETHHTAIMIDKLYLSLELFRLYS